MTERARKHLTYANVVSTVCLFILLGGSAVAASNLINGGRLRNRSVPGKKLELNTVTGREIRVSTLGKVPAARKADSATNATNAANATLAANSNLLAGQTPAQLRTGINAATLGGIAPGGFVQGSGSDIRGAANILSTGPQVVTLATIPGFGTLTADFTSGCQVIFTNDSGDTILYYGRQENDTGGSTPASATPELANGSALVLSHSPDAPRGSWGDWMLRTANFETSSTANSPIHFLQVTAGAFWDDKCRTAVTGLFQ